MLTCALCTRAHSAQPPHLGPDQCDQQHHQDRANATAGDRDDRAEELRRQAGLEAAQFVRCADKDEIDGRNATKQGIGRARHQQRAANDDADGVEPTQQSVWTRIH